MTEYKRKGTGLGCSMEEYSKKCEKEHIKIRNEKIMNQITKKVKRKKIKKKKNATYNTKSSAVSDF